MGNMLTGIISLTISAVILGNVFITVVKGAGSCNAGALGATCNGTAGYGTYQTGEALTASESAMWGLITLVAIVGLVFGVLNVFGLV